MAAHEASAGSAQHMFSGALIFFLRLAQFYNGSQGVIQYDLLPPGLFESKFLKPSMSLWQSIWSPLIHLFYFPRAMKGSLYSNTINNPLLTQRKGWGGRPLQSNTEETREAWGEEWGGNNTYNSTERIFLFCFVFFFHIINTNKFFQCLFFPLKKKKMFSFCVSQEVGEMQTNAFHFCGCCCCNPRCQF